MNNAFKLISLGAAVSGGLAVGMLIGYVKDADLTESKLKDIPSFPI